MKKEKFDSEKLFLLIKNERWKECIKYFKSFKKEFEKIPSAIMAMSYFMPQFLKATESRPYELYIDEYEYIYLMHYDGTFRIQPHELERVIELYLSALLIVKKREKALDIAKRHPDLKVSQTIMSLLV